MNEGCGNAKYTSKEGMHPVDPCECEGISSNDMLDLSQKADCMIFDERRHKKMA
jgi:hypothetical protein